MAHGFRPHTPVGLVDEPVGLVLEGAEPGEKLSVGVSLRDHEGRVWSREFDVDVPRDGTVDIAGNGSHRAWPESDPLRLFHGLVPEEPVRWTNRISSTVQPLTVRVEVCSGDVPVAVTELVRLFSLPGVRRIEWRDEGTTANLYLPHVTSDDRAVIVLPGAWGGFDWCNQVAALIGAHGRPALALPYFDWEEHFGLPRAIEEIPIEYAQRARDRLCRVPGVDPSWTTVLGMSKGAEYGIAWASLDPSVDELIALSPTLYAWESVRESGAPPARSSWSHEGRPLPFLRFDADAEFYETLDKTLLQKFHERAVAEAGEGTPARLPVEDIRARTLLVSLEQDTLWPASWMGDRIVEAMRSAAPGAEVDHVVVPGRGHAVFVAGVPANGVDADAAVNGAAQTLIWSTITSFLGL